MGKRFITEEEALALLPEGDTIHTFISNGGYTLLGTDWDRAEIEAKLHNAEVIEIAGENARSMQHGLAVYNKKISIGQTFCLYKRMSRSLINLIRQVCVIMRGKGTNNGRH